MLQNGAIWGLIASFLANQNAQNTIDFKMNIIKIYIEIYRYIIGRERLSKTVLINYIYIYFDLVLQVFVRQIWDCLVCCFYAILVVQVK